MPEIERGIIPDNLFRWGIMICLIIFWIGISRNRKNRSTDQQSLEPVVTYGDAINQSMVCSNLKEIILDETHNSDDILIQERCIATKIHWLKHYDLMSDFTNDVGVVRYIFRNGHWIGPITSSHDSKDFRVAVGDGLGFMGYNGLVSLWLQPKLCNNSADIVMDSTGIVMNSKDLNRYRNISIQEECIAVRIHWPNSNDFDLDLQKEEGAELKRYAFRDNRWFGPILPRNRSKPNKFYWQMDDIIGLMGYNGLVKAALIKTTRENSDMPP